MKRLESTSRAIPSGIIVLILLIWEGASRRSIDLSRVLPPPSEILTTLFQNIQVLWQHTRITLFEALTGFVISIILAVLLAILMDGIEVIRKALYSILITTQTVPILVIAPLLIMWFGFGYLPKILIVILVCFFPITISLLEGLQSVDKEMLNLLKSMGASRLQCYRLVKLPAAMPNFFAGLKISGTYSIMGAIIGEWVGGKDGLGVYMMRVRHSFAIDKVFATIVIISLLSIALIKIIEIAESKMMPWLQIQKQKNMEE